MITLWGNLFRMQFIALFLFETSCKSMAPVCAATATVAVSRCDEWQNTQDRRSCCARDWNQMKRRCCHKLWLPFADYACSVTHAGIWQYICIYIYIYIYLFMWLYIYLYRSHSHFRWLKKQRFLVRFLTVSVSVGSKLILATKRM